MVTEQLRLTSRICTTTIQAVDVTRGVGGNIKEGNYAMLIAAIGRM